MEIRHLHYFLKAAEYLSFTRAAEALGISQSTLSHQMKQLEQETGPLFDRVGRGIGLTSRGKLFKTYAERIVNDVRTSVVALSELDALVSGQLAIGVYRNFEYSLLPAVLADFSRRYPSVEMRIHTGNHVELTHRLIEGNLDLAVSYAPTISERIVSETLFVEQLVLMVGRQHQFYECAEISLAKLRDLALISVNLENRQRQLIQRYLAAQDIFPRIVIEINSNEAVLAMVKCSNFATICPAVECFGLHSVRLPGLPIKRSTLLLWRRDCHISAAAVAIGKMIKAAYSSLRPRAHA